MKRILMHATIPVVIFISAILNFAYAQYNQIEITTHLKENFYDKSGNPLTGKGVLIGDVDSGIDIFNPMFFFSDGGEYTFIDANKDGNFTPGKDAVDLNKNGKKDKGEVLRYIEMKDGTYKLLNLDPEKFNPDMDFLYVDKNNNGRRDFGIKDGFKESDPTYGEQIFIAVDKNKNDELNKGEKLIALKTSKVRTLREKEGTIRRRGIDLIKHEEADSIFGHGTQVAGVLLGGTKGIQKVHGIATDAELVMAIIKYDYTPRFVKNFPDLVKFIKDEKANILLIEDGEFGWEFLDGSTEEEQLLNEYAREGMTIIGGAGNLGGSKLHMKDTLNPGVSKTYTVSAPEISEGKINNGAFVTFLWKDSVSDLTFEIETPDKNETIELNTGSGFIKAGGFNVSYAKEISSKGTGMMKFGFSKSDSGSIKGNWKIMVNSPEKIIIDGFVVDISQSWAPNTHWTSNYSDESIVTFPVTADSMISVGAYAVNYGWYEQVGDLATYSPRGYNIDGRLGVDITGPGHSSFSTSIGNGYTIFTGTSSAAPHVTGAAALMLQYDPSLTHSQIKQIIINTAKKDNFTGEVPNTDWGYGKLDIEEAIKFLIKNNP
ncbi:MAG: S8 family serine peptidase [Ignavibacteria bacterium]|nr:S8 family serine peptidase [Ignavibacteria bacterium]